MDSGGFEDFCRQHYSGLARLAFLLTGDRQEALDLTQEGSSGLSSGGAESPGSIAQRPGCSGWWRT